MNVKEKLEGFSRIAIQEAEEKRIKMLNEMNAEFKRACDEITLRERKKADALLDEERVKAEQAKNKEIIQASTEAKRSLIELRSQLTDDLFHIVLAKLADYIETDNYTSGLVKDVKDLAIKYGGKITVYLCRRDMIFSGQLMEIPHVKVMEAPDEMAGGYRAVLENQKIVIDQSYQEKMAEARANFTGFRIHDGLA